MGEATWGLERPNPLVENVTLEFFALAPLLISSAKIYKSYYNLMVKVTHGNLKLRDQTLT